MTAITHLLDTTGGLPSAGNGSTVKHQQSQQVGTAGHAGMLIPLQILVRSSISTLFLLRLIYKLHACPNSAWHT
jgi:hypothetical protein